MRGEREFIRLIEHRARRSSPDVVVGIGDDAALIVPKAETCLVIASDVIVEDVHFRRRYFPPQALGHKALAVNLSDIAAMGATPRYFLLTLGLPADCEDWFADQILAGILALADQHNVVLIGGDTSHAPERIFIDITILGEVTRSEAVQRSGAQVGDLIYVSGELGDSAAGLAVLQNQASTGSLHNTQISIQAAIRSHLQPQPRLKLGRILAHRHLATAMMDISDGLSIDLARLCEKSSVGARLQADTIPISSAAQVISSRNRQSPLQLALHGGEDYELLFTVSPQNQAAVTQLQTVLAETGDSVPLTCIGQIQPVQDGLQIETLTGIHPLEIKGYDHFR